MGDSNARNMQSNCQIK